MISRPSYGISDSYGAPVAPPIGPASTPWPPTTPWPPPRPTTTYRPFTSRPPYLSTTTSKFVLLLVWYKNKKKFENQLFYIVHIGDK